VEATVAPVATAHLHPVRPRGDGAALVPMGKPLGELTVFGNTSRGGQRFGDPLLELSVNVIGKPPIRTMPDLLRYEPGFSLDLLATWPSHREYDGDQR